MKKKIIFVTKALWIGGIETALINLLNYFNYDKYDVTLLVLRAELELLHQVNPKCRLLVVDRDQNITFDRKYKFSRLYHMTEETDQPSALHKAMMWTVPAIKWTENRLYIRYVKNLMSSEMFDTAIIYSDAVAEIAIRAVRADKYIMFYHHGAMRHVYHDKIAYRKCEKIVAVSQNQAEMLRKFAPKYRNKITVIHNLIDVNGIRIKGNCCCEDVFDPTRFNIVTVGRVSEEKGIDIAIRCCEKLVQAGYQDILWWIIGDGPAMTTVRELVSELKLEKYVKLVGMKNNPYPYIKQADLYVQPSRFEGYPMTILEALVLGQPVVSTDNQGAKEILKEYITGILKPIDAEEITQGIKEVLINPLKFADMKQNVCKLDFEQENIKSVKLIERYI